MVHLHRRFRGSRSSGGPVNLLTAGPGEDSRRLGETGRQRVMTMLRELGEPDVAFDQAAIGMAMVDFDGDFLRVNSALCDLVGRSKPELLALKWQDITYPADVSHGEQEVVRALTGQERTFRLAKRYVCRDGSLIWVLLNVSLIRSRDGEPLCLFTQAVDISEQRRAEEAVARLAAIVESSDEVILSMTLDGTILSWNGAAERMHGYRSNDILGENVRTIVPGHLTGELVQLLDVVAGGASITNHQTVRMRSDGSQLDVSITISPIRNAAGEAVGAATITRDITVQKRMAEELDATLAALENALAEARAAEERSRKFLSDAAHHLRNPVAGIRSCVETLLRGCPLAERDRLVTEVIRDTSRVSRLVDRLLKMSRLAQGEPMALAPADLADVCRDVVERAQSLAPHLLIELAAEPLEPIHCDSEAVRDVVASLLENGCRHARRRAEVAVYRSGRMVCVRVRDDGPGMVEAEVEHAFEPFVSMDGSGSGLGLAISRAVALAHGGDLVHEDGAFRLRLPLSPSACDEMG